MVFLIEALSKSLRGFTEGLTIPYSLRGYTVSNYKVTLTFTTPDDPRGLIFPLVDKIKDVVRVTSSTYQLVEDRPTNDEHHGGIVNDEST